MDGVGQENDEKAGQRAGEGSFYPEVLLLLEELEAHRGFVEAVCC